MHSSVVKVSLNALSCSDPVVVFLPSPLALYSLMKTVSIESVLLGNRYLPILQNATNTVGSVHCTSIAASIVF